MLVAERRGARRQGENAPRTTAAVHLIVPRDSSVWRESTPNGCHFDNRPAVQPNTRAHDTNGSSSEEELLVPPFIISRKVKWKNFPGLTIPPPSVIRPILCVENVYLNLYATKERKNIEREYIFIIF